LLNSRAYLGTAPCRTCERDVWAPEIQLAHVRPPGNKGIVTQSAAQYLNANAFVSASR